MMFQFSDCDFRFQIVFPKILTKPIIINSRLCVTHTLTVLGFPCGSAGKESACNAENLGSIPGLGRSAGGGKGYPLQYSGLEISMDCMVHGVQGVQQN